jgi:hypothetical protein
MISAMRWTSESVYTSFLDGFWDDNISSDDDDDDDGDDHDDARMMVRMVTGSDRVRNE